MVVDGHMIRTSRCVATCGSRPTRSSRRSTCFYASAARCLNELEERGASGFDRWPQWAPDLATLHRTLNYRERYVLTMCMLRPMVESAA